MVGMALGSVIFPLIADRWGRKFSMCLSGFIILVVSTIIAFSPRFWMFAVMEVLSGAADLGYVVGASAITMELVPTNRRSTINAVYNILWGLAVGLCAIFFYVMKDMNWRYQQLVVGLMSVHVIVLPWWLDESWRWLASQGKYDQIEKLIKKAARYNNRNEKEILHIYRQHVVQNPLLSKSCEINWSSSNDQQVPLNPEVKETSLGVKTNVDTPNVCDLFKDRHIVQVTLILWFMWITDNLAYYGLSLIPTILHKDHYVGFGLTAISDLAAAFTFWYAVERFGRKRACLGFHLAASVTLLTSVLCEHFADQLPWLSVAVSVLSMAGKFSISTSYCILWLYTPEIYPTTLRSIGLGLASFVARFGGYFAPFTRIIRKYHPWVPSTVFGSLCIIVIFLIQYLPETHGRELPQTLNDLKIMIKEDRVRRKEKSPGRHERIVNDSEKKCHLSNCFCK